MYLEISARQSGKTMRLIEAVEKYLHERSDTYAVVVCSEERLAYLLRSIIVDRPVGRHDARRFVLANREARIVAADRMVNAFGYQNRCHPGRGLVKYFVDDFDRVPDCRLEIDPNAYYATSPERIREPWEIDFLTQIVEAAGDKYEVYGFRGEHRSHLRLVGEKVYQKHINYQWRRQHQRQPAGA